MSIIIDRRYPTDIFPGINVEFGVDKMQFADTYKLASCGFNNQVTQIMGKAVFAQRLADGLIVKEEA